MPGPRPSKLRVLLQSCPLIERRHGVIRSGHCVTRDSSGPYWIDAMAGQQASHYRLIYVDATRELYKLKWDRRGAFSMAL